MRLLANEIFEPIRFNPYYSSTGLNRVTSASQGAGNANFGALLSAMLMGSAGSNSVGSLEGLDPSGLLSSGDALSSAGFSNAGSQNSLMLMLMSALGSENASQQGLGQMLSGLSGAGNTSTPYANALQSYASTGTADLTSTSRNRSPALYRAVLDKFNVETNPRYAINQKGEGDTYCNLYVLDAAEAMDAKIPRSNANGINTWLNGQGAANGWVKVSAREAQMYANQGMPAVASWYNTSGKGHVSMVAPSSDGQYSEEKGVAIAQAGSKLIRNGYITDVYKKNAADKLDYFVHI